VRVRIFVAAGFGAAAFGLAGGAPAAPPIAAGPPATAEALGVQVVGPDEGILAATTDVTAPPSSDAQPAPFAYPDDGSVVSAQGASTSVSASAVDGTASATAELTGVSLFGGEITADDVRGSVSSAGTIGELTDSTVTNLAFLGTPVPIVANARVPLADWGYLITLPQTTKTGTAARPSWSGTVTALVIHLNVDHGGLLAGSEIRLGYADAASRPPQQAGSTTTSSGATTTSATPRPKAPKPKLGPKPILLPPPSLGAAGSILNPPLPKPKKQSRARQGPGGIPLGTPPSVTPKLAPGGYVFPVYGPSAYSDTFGAFRGDVSGGWHHGDDIFAPLGAPVLAVATGTVFSVGWNPVGGWRLWVRDQQGNEFYYAHLSAYTRLAVDGAHVKAGEVLAFVGNTGDAQGTPFHLHFEVHPVSMLYIGYDGAVDPTKYLDAWKRLQDVRILPAIPFSGVGAGIPSSSAVPAPGAILLESSDISTANGLDPASLKRAMNGPATVDVTNSGVAALPTPLPNLDRA
jgi:murein DD-endopeptidase MepM/ murein hydrolase activator NlpD